MYVLAYYVTVDREEVVGVFKLLSIIQLSTRADTVGAAERGNDKLTLAFSGTTVEDMCARST